MSARRRKTKGAAGAAGQGLTAPEPADATPAAPVDSDTPGPNGLSRALADQLVANRRTMPRRFAATAAGVSPRTFERWIQIGASSGDDPICIELARRIFEVEGQDVSESISDLKMLRTMSATASEAYLRLMHPADFGGAVRSAPDEFEDQVRNREAQDKLLASPPPRMLAKLREHRWFQVPAEATKEELAAVETMIANIRMRLTNERALAAQGQGKG